MCVYHNRCPVRLCMPRVRWCPSAAFDGSESSWPLERLRALAYVVGVILKGDGSVYKTRVKDKLGRPRGMRAEIALRVISIEFARHFCTSLAVVLGRNRTKIKGPYQDNCFVAKYCSIDFYYWWTSRSHHDLRRITARFPYEYLRGRFDSESGVGSYAVYIFGAEDHKWVLDLDNRLCRRLGMRTGPVLPYGRVGERTNIYGREVITRMQKLRFSVNATDFIRVIGGIIVPDRNRRLFNMVRGRRWTPWNEGIRRSAMSLRRRGLSLGEISKELLRRYEVNVPALTIYYWGRGTSSWKRYASRTYPKAVKAGCSGGRLGP